MHLLSSLPLYLPFYEHKKRPSYLSARKQTSLDDMIFINFFGDVLQPACHETISVKHSFLGVFRLFPQATLERLRHVLFLTDLYLECSYKDLRCLRKVIGNKMNTPEETNSDFLYLIPNV